MKFQIGKLGINEGVLTALALAFKTHKAIRISCLKSSGRDKQTITNMAEELSTKLKSIHETFTYKIIGFTIILIKQKGKSFVKKRTSKQGL